MASSSSGASPSSPFPSSSSSSCTSSPSADINPALPPHYFPTPALDHAFSGIVAGAVATVCMNPLDLIKVQFQVDTRRRRSRPPTSSRFRGMVRTVTGGDVARDMTSALRNIVERDGWKGLYRGLSPNVIGNSASWGFYFLWYTMIKEYMARPDPTKKDGKQRQLSPGQHLLAASESGAVTALMTNPIWVVKTRMFTTSRSGYAVGVPPSSTTSASPTMSSSTINAAFYSPQSSNPTISPEGKPTTYRGLIEGLRHIWRYEGMKGMYKGGGLALFGVSNGAIQFVCYEELKRWRMDVAKRKAETRGDLIQTSTDNAVKLHNLEYIVISGLAKVGAIGITYPYQVIRSRIQNHATAHIYPTIPTCIRLTWQNEGFRGFYKGMAANLVRIIPGTCVTFVVYENSSWALRGLAERKAQRERQASSGSEIST